ncbi:MAG: hypothetical protein Q4B45_00025 [Coriobacteriia bacterium]|nr:hypothetical protein [Coriobacteriia bacterium]
MGIKSHWSAERLADSFSPVNPNLLSGESEQFGYAKAADGKAINWMVVEKSTVIKFDKHVASRVFSPNELENLGALLMGTIRAALCRHS